MLRTIEAAIRLVANGLALIAGVVLLLMMIQTAADVFMANFFGRPIEGNLEIIATYHMVLVVFLPLAIVELRHEHITVDLFVRLLPRAVQRAVAVLGYLISAGFLAILTYQTWLDAVNSWRINEIEMGAIYITVWPAKFALPVGFFTMLLALLLHAWKAAFDSHFDPVPADPENVSEPA